MAQQVRDKNQEIFETMPIPRALFTLAIPMLFLFDRIFGMYGIVWTRRGALRPRSQGTSFLLYS